MVSILFTPSPFPLLSQLTRVCVTALHILVHSTLTGTRYFLVHFVQVKNPRWEKLKYRVTQNICTKNCSNVNVWSCYEWIRNIFKLHDI